MTSIRLSFLAFLVFIIIISPACEDDNGNGGGMSMDDDMMGQNPCNDLTLISYNPVAYDLNIPEGFPAMEIPENNPLTVDGVELGRHLFYDTILSSDSTMSCAHCHHPTGGFTDNLAVSTGVDGIAGTRSSMSLINVGFYNTGLFWDGRVVSLEDQALLPVEDPIELHDQWPHVEEKLQRSNFYPELFRKAFGIEDNCEITRDLATKAIAQFERSLVSFNSRYDKIKYQLQGFFSDDELMGEDMFFDISPEVADAECGHCHNDGSRLLTDNSYRNNGLDTVFTDEGLGGVTGVSFDIGKFRVPSLRNIEHTAPYMHDGRFQTLEEVIDHYNSGGHITNNLDPLMHPLELTEQEKGQLLTFLKTFTDTTFINDPRYQNPFD